MIVTSRRDRNSGDAKVAGTSRSPLLRLPMRSEFFRPSKNQELLAPAAPDCAWFKSIEQDLRRRARLEAECLAEFNQPAALSTYQRGKSVRTTRATADLVVFDTQSRFHGGPENDNTAGAVFIRALEVVAKKTGAAVVAISHVGKNKDTNGDQYDRGASSLIDNARGAMKLTRLPSELTERLADPVQIEKADCGNIVRLIHSKNSYGPAHKEEYLERRSNGILLPTVLMFKGSQGPTPFAPTLVELAAQLMRTIGCGEVSRNQVYEDYQRWCGPAATRDGAVRAFDFAVAAHQL